VPFKRQLIEQRSLFDLPMPHLPRFGEGLYHEYSLDLSNQFAEGLGWVAARLFDFCLRFSTSRYAFRQETKNFEHQRRTYQSRVS
jgi:hypothetical protein